ncbi:MAG: hypothetical protein IJF67_00620 [Clostridia bacterium]|nr:hypothetical protein [Clostridia bacterium]
MRGEFVTASHACGLAGGSAIGGCWRVTFVCGLFRLAAARRATIPQQTFGLP